MALPSAEVSQKLCELRTALMCAQSCQWRAHMAVYMAHLMQKAFICLGMEVV